MEDREANKAEGKQQQEFVTKDSAPQHGGHPSLSIESAFSVKLDSHLSSNCGHVSPISTINDKCLNILFPCAVSEGWKRERTAQITLERIRWNALFLVLSSPKCKIAKPRLLTAL